MLRKTNITYFFSYMDAKARKVTIDHRGEMGNRRYNGGNSLMT